MYHEFTIRKLNQANNDEIYHAMQVKVVVLVSYPVTFMSIDYENQCCYLHEELRFIPKRKNILISIQIPEVPASISNRGCSDSMSSVEGGER